MKKTMMYTVSLLLVMLMVAPVWVFAQNQEQLQKFSHAELDQMLAPIALYPDSLLAQILMAATYPLEVVMADRWVKAHPNLRGDQLNTELDNQSWDPSVKALVPFPQVLVMMSEKLEWTEKLGDAFLDQQEEVMDTVQGLREKAQEAGNLKSTKEQQVVVRERIIVIEPVNPDVIYIPVYNPFIVYGRWWYPAYPPFWYYPPGYVVTRVVFAFPFFCVVGPSWHFAWGHWDWPHHRVYVNVNRTININHTYISHTDIRTTTWQHDVSHRRGVAYRSEPIRERYTPTKGSVDSRRDFRGFDQGVKTAPKVSSKPPTIQQPPLSGRPGSDRLRGGTVSSGPPVIQQPQRSDSKKPEASKVSNVPSPIQQSPTSNKSGSNRMGGSTVSSRPSPITQPQASNSGKPEPMRVTNAPTIQQPGAIVNAGMSGNNRVNSVPTTVKQPQPSAVFGSKRPEGNKVSSTPPPLSQPKVSRGTDSNSSASSGNNGKAVFGSMDRGSEVKRQSERGAQSRGATIIGGGDASSSHVNRLSGSSPAAGKGSSNGSGQQNGVKEGSGDSGHNGSGSGQGGVVYQKDPGRGNERTAEVMTKSDHDQTWKKVK